MRGGARHEARRACGRARKPWSWFWSWRSPGVQGTKKPAGERADDERKRRFRSISSTPLAGNCRKAIAAATTARSLSPHLSGPACRRFKCSCHQGEVASLPLPATASPRRARRPPPRDRVFPPGRRHAGSRRTAARYRALRKGVDLAFKGRARAHSRPLVRRGGGLYRPPPLLRVESMGFPRVLGAKKPAGESGPAAPLEPNSLAATLLEPASPCKWLSSESRLAAESSECPPLAPVRTVAQGALLRGSVAAGGGPYAAGYLKRL